MEKRKVIIDCDPGIDDSLAILLALASDELEVLGLTITSGNVPAILGAKNALKTLQIASRLDIPVYVGEKLPLKRKLVTAQDTHGEDGIGENFYDDVEGEILEDGVDFIIDTLKNNKDKWLRWKKLEAKQDCWYSWWVWHCSLLSLETF